MLTEERELRRPTQENVIDIIEELTTGHGSDKWCTGSEIAEHLTNKRQVWYKLKSIRKHMDSVIAKHSTTLDYQKQGRASWLYRYKET